jgi:hypothetical protein
MRPATALVSLNRLPGPRVGEKVAGYLKTANV